MTTAVLDRLARHLCRRAVSATSPPSARRRRAGSWSSRRCGWHQVQHKLDHERGLDAPDALTKVIGLMMTTFAVRTRYELSAYLAQIASDGVAAEVYAVEPRASRLPLLQRSAPRRQQDQPMRKQATAATTICSIGAPLDAAPIAPPDDALLAQVRKDLYPKSSMPPAGGWGDKYGRSNPTGVGAKGRMTEDGGWRLEMVTLGDTRYAIGDVRQAIRETMELDFGARLKRRRQALDLTQGDLAERAFCSVTSIRKIEAGDLIPSKELASEIANAGSSAARCGCRFCAFCADAQRNRTGTGEGRERDGERRAAGCRMRMRLP